MSWRRGGAWLLHPRPYSKLLFRDSDGREFPLHVCRYVITHKSPRRSSGEKRDGVSSFARRPREVVHSSSSTIITRVMPPELRAPRLCYLSFTIIVVIIIIHYTFLRICRRGWSVCPAAFVGPSEKKKRKKNLSDLMHRYHYYTYIGMYTSLQRLL